MNTTELVKRETVESLCQAHHDAIADLKAAGQLISRGIERINSTRIGDGYEGNHHWPHNCTPDHLVNPNGLAEIIDEMNRSAWRVIINAVGLRSLVSVADCKKIDDALYGKGEKMPELTPENVWGWLAAISDQLPKLLDDSIKEVFGFLRPWRSEHKTNSQYEIGKRVIVQWMQSDYSGKPKMNYYHEKHANALDNVFHLLDGKGPVKQGQSKPLTEGAEPTPVNLVQAIRAAEDQRQKTLVAETEYFRVKGYLAGTCHIEFKRPDLLAELNRIGGGGSLKHDNRAAKQWEHTEAGGVARTY